MTEATTVSLFSEDAAVVIRHDGSVDTVLPPGQAADIVPMAGQVAFVLGVIVASDEWPDIFARVIHEQTGLKEGEKIDWVPPAA